MISPGVRRRRNDDGGFFFQLSKVSSQLSDGSRISLGPDGPGRGAREKAARLVGPAAAWPTRGDQALNSRAKLKKDGEMENQ